MSGKGYSINLYMNPYHPKTICAGFSLPRGGGHKGLGETVKGAITNLTANLPSERGAKIVLTNNFIVWGFGPDGNKLDNEIFSSIKAKLSKERPDITFF
ncbi:hypothetical protein GOV13_01735 [Candidatus Pacearchaeota archaeon]|nr:hypothetical protein [Candidatus Pacearchaeota archaeon]